MEREAKLAKERNKDKMKNIKNPVVSALIFCSLIASNVAARPIKIPPAPTPDSALDQVWAVLTALWTLL